MASTGFYRFKDLLDNFVLKVQLRRLTRREESDGKEAEEVQEFQWQQKLFNAREEEIYATVRPLAPEREKAYNEVLHKQLESNNGVRPNRRLFSYIEGDPECIEVGVSQPLTSASHEVATAPSHMTTAVRRRGIKRSKQPVIDRPTLEQRAQNRVVTPPSWIMLIMADLGDLQGLQDERVLCTIKVSKDGVLSLSPTLSEGSEWTKIESSWNEMFEYKFEHTSSTISSSNKEKEKNIVQELNRQRVGEILTSVGDSFADPPSSSVSVMVLGEVVSARDFEYEDLYITTSLKLPRGWKCTSHSEEELTLLSQISHSKSLHLTNVAHFSLPFEYHLLFSCKHEEESDDANEECCHLLSMPTFHFEVGSIDTWDRHRMEGYAHWSLPPQPGYYSPSVSTWRPMGKSLLEELRRFFVGGGPQLEDITYSGIPADVKGFNVAKYGMRTKTAGSVQLRVHIVHQSRELQESHVNTLPTTSQSALLFSTETILENYRQTKLKMAASLKNQSTDSLEQD